MKDYSPYTIDQLQDLLCMLSQSPSKNSEQIIAIKAEINKKLENPLKNPPENPENSTLEDSLTGAIAGIGFVYIGKRDIEEDSSYISTLWFVLLLIPIFPLKSARVHTKDGDFKMKSFSIRLINYKVEKTALNLKQIRNVYLSFYGSLFCVLSFVWFFGPYFI